MRVRNGHWIALGALLALTGAWILYETRGTAIWFDEWQFALDRRGTDGAAFLEPHNEHLSLVPVLLYKLLFATAGIDDYVPYRVMIALAHLACVTLVFVLARRRVGDGLALVAAILLLGFGPGWQNILWPFQVGSLLSIAAGLGALLALEREDRRGDACAAVLLGVSLASTGLGLSIAAGLAVELALRRRLRAAWWVLAAPLALYAAWWLAYRPAGLIRHNIVLVPGFAADAAAGIVAALAGLADAPVGSAGETLGWGRPLAVAVAVLVAWRLATLPRVTPRAWALLAILVSFWVLTGLRRAELIRPDETRYLYFGAVFLLLLGAELARGVALTRRAWAVVAVAVTAIVVANAGDLRDGARFVRAQAAVTRADLGALELARERVAPDHVLAGLPGYPFLAVDAGSYFDVAREYGTPAERPDGAPEEGRRAADGELVRAYGLALESAGRLPAETSPPDVGAATGGVVVRDERCVTFTPAPVAPAGEARAVELTVPPGGVALRAGAGAATVSVRRFATTFAEPGLGQLAPGALAELRIPPDASGVPWTVRVAPETDVTACGLPGGP